MEELGNQYHGAPPCPGSAAKVFADKLAGINPSRAMHKALLAAPYHEDLESPNLVLTVIKVGIQIPGSAISRDRKVKCFYGSYFPSLLASSESPSVIYLTLDGWVRTPIPPDPNDAWGRVDFETVMTSASGQ